MLDSIESWHKSHEICRLFGNATRKRNVAPEDLSCLFILAVLTRDSEEFEGADFHNVYLNRRMLNHLKTAFRDD